MSKIRKVLELAESYGRVPEVVQDRGQELKTAVTTASSPEEAAQKVLEIVRHYYANIQWSVEKAEWDKLTPEQQQQLAGKIISYVTR